MEKEFRWHGLGRWLSFAIAVLFVTTAIPNIVANDPAGGWNLFLGLLLFGVVASGSRRAPSLVLVLVGLTVLRFLLLIIGEWKVADLVVNGLAVVALLIAWQDLRKQAAALNGGGRAQAT